LTITEVPVLLRTSERTSYKKCRQQWWWAYVEQLKAKQERSALAFGTDAHEVLEIRYPKGRKRGPKPALIAKKMWNARLKAGIEVYTLPVGGEQVNADEFLVHMMENYYEEYGDDERYEVIASEHTFAVDVHHPKSGRFLFTYVGTIDGVWKDLHHDTIVFAEHKTGATLEPFGAPIYLDEQQAAYWAYGPIWLEHQGLIRKGQQIDHVLYNRLRKGYRDDRPKDAAGHRLNKPGKEALTNFLVARKVDIPRASKVEDLMALVAGTGQDPLLLGEISKNQGVPLFKREPVMRTPDERIITMNRAINEFMEMEHVRNGRLAVIKNPDRHCGYCAYRDVCEIHEGGGDYKLLLKVNFEHWEPYDAHELELEMAGED
jgi:hypothetical protein